MRVLRHSLYTHCTMSTQQYFCDCPARCKRRKAVSRTTYYDHARFRLPLSENFNTFAALHRVEAPTPWSSGRDTADSRVEPSSSSVISTHKRSRLQSVDEEAGQGSINEGLSSARDGHEVSPNRFLVFKPIYFYSEHYRIMDAI